MPRDAEDHSLEQKWAEGTALGLGGQVSPGGRQGPVALSSKFW